MMTADRNVVLKRFWISLPRWAKLMVLALGILIATAWCAMGLALAIVLYDSPLGCPPTTGCHARKASDCSASWLSGWQASNHEPCDK